MVLLPVLLVEPRYYLSSFVLFLLLRQGNDTTTEVVLWGWFAFLATWLHQGITVGLFLL